VVGVENLTPVERHAGVWVKRDDLFQTAGVNGGKARACLHLAQNQQGLVSCGSRTSVQLGIVAAIARDLQIKAVLHVADGKDTPEIEEARTAGAEVIKHKAGYISVLIARSRDYAHKYKFKEIPFGMRCLPAIELVSQQVQNLPVARDVNRIIVPVGGGVHLAGVLCGIDLFRPDLSNKKIVGVTVGGDPTKFLHSVCPFGWRNRVSLTPAAFSYTHPHHATLGQLNLDPYYEAKAADHLRPKDVFWVVGIRTTL
jgi:1-aminocyclopropane-1-carboxylate deaminase/D-cysteine desulfhydrase-like pyridoxal-dependent ACC family enzyme